MATNIINGYSFPKFKILDTDNNQIGDDIDLCVTNSDGLIESYGNEDIIHILEKNREIVKIYKDERITFTLHYNQFIDSENLLKIDKIHQLERNGYKVMLYPRSDILSRRFEVTYTGDEIQIGLNQDAEQGHRLLIVKWETKRLEKRNWIDANIQYFFKDSVAI